MDNVKVSAPFRLMARRELSDSLPALQAFILTHVVIAKPLHRFALHALDHVRFHRPQSLDLPVAFA
jgi:hypothetical protein